MKNATFENIDADASTLKKVAKEAESGYLLPPAVVIMGLKKSFTKSDFLQIKLLGSFRPNYICEKDSLLAENSG